MARNLPGSAKGNSTRVACVAAALAAWTGTVLSQVPPGACPQPRATVKAPGEIYTLVNPMRPTAERIATGRKLYEKTASPPCETCHGAKGDGMGTLAAQFDPRPRNFTCAQMLDEIPDGQLFWIIRNGSPDTSMPAYTKLSDRQIWRIILYLRTLVKAK